MTFDLALEFLGVFHLLHRPFQKSLSLSLNFYVSSYKPIVHKCKCWPIYCFMVYLKPVLDKGITYHKNVTKYVLTSLNTQLQKMELWLSYIDIFTPQGSLTFYIVKLSRKIYVNDLFSHRYRAAGTGGGWRKQLIS